MSKKLLLTLLFVGVLSAVQADEARLLRFPSTNGQEVVFTYAGDLYKAPLAGGQAQRLTSHVGVEMFARYSPDGSTIAFTGQYDGNTEIFLMSGQGGEPKRITYTATNSRDDLGDRMGPNNIAMTWSRDGENIIYRNRIGDGFSGKLWQVSKDGGMPKVLPLPEGGFCSYSPDGKRLAYNRVMREFRTWKYYKGGMADDIWIYDPAANKVENVTNNVSQDIFPMWIGDEIFFISDRDMVMNLFVYNTATKKTEKVTNFTDFDIKFPSTDGSVIVDRLQRLPSRSAARIPMLVLKLRMSQIELRQQASLPMAAALPLLLVVKFLMCPPPRALHAILPVRRELMSVAQNGVPMVSI